METSRIDMARKTSTKVDEHEQNLIVKGTPGLKSIEWTDEKHSLYLKSMEASFVDHLYGSLDLLGWHSQNGHLSRPKSLRQKHANPSGQYKVFQDGCWTKIDFSKDEPQLNKTNESSAVLASPWIIHYKSPGRHQMRVNSEIRRNTTSEQNQSPDCHKDCGSITEVMDQNFVDEDPEEGKSSREHSTKRTKISLGAGSSSDQVVPFACSMAADLLESTD